MEDLERRWRRALCHPLHRTPTITDDGVVLGFGTVLIRRYGEAFALPSDGERAIYLLSIVARQAQPNDLVEVFRRAFRCWNGGDPSLAHIHLAFAKLVGIGDEDDAWRLFQAAYLLDADMAPRALMKAVGLDTSAFFLGKMSCLNKYDPDQPRHPAGSGQDSGRWSRGPGSGTSLSLAPNAAGVPSLAAELAPEAVAWLVRFAARLSLPTAVLGAALIPSANPGLAEEGTVPGRSDLRYHLDRDAGLLRLSAAADPDPTHALVAQLGSGGLYREVETGVPVARALGDAVTLMDLDRGPVEKDEPDGDRKAATSGAGPKLCPAPTEDWAGGRKQFDVTYQQFVRDFVNPQRQPQLEEHLAFALPAATPSGWVHYDDCRESDGAMIEAKGNYADFLAKPIGKEVLSKQWLEQADHQTKGAGSRRVEWYFHDPEAAMFARELFAKRYSSIGVYVLSYPGGVPKHNPRVR